MSGFSVDWLTLRAGADDRARAPALLERVKVWAGDGPLLIADLGGGCGATRRALGSHLPAARWRLLDNDSALLDQAPPGADLETVAVDLAARPEAAFFPRRTWSPLRRFSILSPPHGSIVSSPSSPRRARRSTPR